MADRHSAAAPRRHSHSSPRRRKASAWTPVIGWRTTIPMLVVLAIAIHALLPHLATIDETLGVLQRMRWWAVGLAIAAQAASNMAGGYLIQRVAALTADSLSIARSVRIGLAASSVGLVAGGPLGYAAATAHWLRKEGVSGEGAALMGWMPSIFNAATMLLVAVFGLLDLVILRGFKAHGLLSVVLVLGGLIGVAALAIGVVSDERRLLSLVSRARRWWGRLRHHPVDEHALAQDRQRIASARHAFTSGAWRGLALGAALNAAFDLLSLFLLFAAAGYPIGPARLVAGYGLPEVVGRISIFPGGLGVVEGGMVGLYRALGVPPTIAVVVVLAYRALSFWLPTLAGAPLAIAEQRRAAG